MDFSSFPSYPRLQWPRIPARRDKTDQGHSPQAASILPILSFLGAIALLLSSFNLMGTAIKQASAQPTKRASQQPLEFKVVMDRFGKVRIHSDPAEVEELLGRPFPINGNWEADLREWTEQAEHSNRHVKMPKDRFWTVWSDPNDENRGVAILFAGEKVYRIAKKGF